jgi:hypothetical protein
LNTEQRSLTVQHFGRFSLRGRMRTYIHRSPARWFFE